MSTSTAQLTSIKEQYKDQTIFITGVTGFVGQVLIEKLLYSCPGIKRIYVLIRGKRGKATQQRWEEMTESILFHRIHRDCPTVLSKVFALEGDISVDGLGLSEESRNTIINEVTMIFHIAATIKFCDTIHSSVNLNVRAVTRVIALAKQIKRLSCLLHCSTAYSNCDNKNIDETLYPPACDPHKLMQTLDWMSPAVADEMTDSLILPRPNTYTFTKALAEHLVATETEGVPALIVRPSIVTGVWKDGIPGWVDGLHGAAALMFAGSSGAIGPVPGSSEVIIDYIPVDVVTNCMIATAAKRMVSKDKDVPVYNVTSSTINPCKKKLHAGTVMQMAVKYPMEKLMMPPNYISTDRHNLEYTKHQLKSVVAGPAIDAVGGLFGAKPFWAKAYSRSRDLLQVLKPFTINEWFIDSKNVPNLYDSLSKEDQEEFNFDVRQVDWVDHMCDFMAGIKYFLAKEDIFDDKRIEKARANLSKMNGVFFILSLFLCYFAAVLTTFSITPWPVFFLFLFFYHLYYNNIDYAHGVVIKTIESYRVKVKRAMKVTQMPPLKRH